MIVLPFICYVRNNFQFGFIPFLYYQSFSQAFLCFAKIRELILISNLISFHNTNTHPAFTICIRIDILFLYYILSSLIQSILLASLARVFALKYDLYIRSSTHILLLVPIKTLNDSSHDDQVYAYPKIDSFIYSRMLKLLAVTYLGQRTKGV